MIAIAFLVLGSNFLTALGLTGALDMNEQPRTIAIHTSLIRPILLMGAERELVLARPSSLRCWC